MIVSGAEGGPMGLFGGSLGPLYQNPAGGGTFIPSPIGKPTGSGSGPRAFRGPGVPLTPSTPTFWERKGAEVGAEVKRERKGS